MVQGGMAKGLGGAVPLGGLLGLAQHWQRDSHVGILKVLIVHSVFSMKVWDLLP